MRNRARRAFWSLRDRRWKCRKEKCARKTFVERSFVPFARPPDCRWVYVDSRRRPKVSNAQIAVIDKQPGNGSIRPSRLPVRGLTVAESGLAALAYEPG